MRTGTPIPGALRRFTLLESRRPRARFEGSSRISTAAEHKRLVHFTFGTGYSPLLYFRPKMSCRKLATGCRCYRCGPACRCQLQPARRHASDRGPRLTVCRGMESERVLCEAMLARIPAQKDRWTGEEKARVEKAVKAA
eukprot:351895-Chlamydomonas_euryale.AAC.3